MYVMCMPCTMYVCHNSGPLGNFVIAYPAAVALITSEKQFFFQIFFILSIINSSHNYQCTNDNPLVHVPLLLVSISNVNMTVTDTDLIEFNDSVTFNCSASGTPLRFQWISGMSVLVPNDRIQISNNDKYSILTIKEVTRFDTGPFFCNVSNDISHKKSLSVGLNISCEYWPTVNTLWLIVGTIECAWSQCIHRRLAFFMSLKDYGIQLWDTTCIPDAPCRPTLMTFNQYNHFAQLLQGFLKNRQQPTKEFYVIILESVYLVRQA